MYNTLVIHPRDPTTDFLKPLYANMRDKTVVRGGANQEDIRELIRNHKTIVMLGHGSPFGLFSVGQFPDTCVIGDQHGALLQTKETVCVWCNADKFARPWELNGFYTGMFISERHEAAMMGIYGVPQAEIDQSNAAFAEAVGQVADRGTFMMYAAAKHRYRQMTPVSRVARFNQNRMYHSTTDPKWGRLTVEPDFVPLSAPQYGHAFHQGQDHPDNEWPAQWY